MFLLPTSLECFMYVFIICLSRGPRSPAYYCLSLSAQPSSLAGGTAGRAPLSILCFKFLKLWVPPATGSCLQWRPPRSSRATVCPASCWPPGSAHRGAALAVRCPGCLPWHFGHSCPQRCPASLIVSASWRGRARSSVE